MQNTKEKSAEYGKSTWYLMAKPPFVEYINLTTGNKHRIYYGSGSQVCLKGSEHYFPANGCDRPMLAIYLHTYALLMRYMPIMLLCVIGIIVVYLAMLTLHPNGAEVFMSSMTYLGHWVTIFSFAVFALLFLFVIVVLGSQVSHQNRPAGEYSVKELPGKSGSGNPWSPIDLQEDVLVYSLSPNETDTEFFSRLDKRLPEASPSRWVVAMQFRNTLAMIYTGHNDYITFYRAKPSYEQDDWPDEQKTCQYSTPFRAESWEQYKDYLDRFCPAFLEWAPQKKVDLFGDEAGKIYLDMLKNKVTTVILALFCALPLFGQNLKSVELDNYLGLRANEVVGKGTVTFAFERGRFPRQSDGTKTFAEELKDVDLYSDRDAGRLLAVSYTNERGDKFVIKRVSSAQASTQPGTPVQRPNARPAAQEPETLEPPSAGTPIMDAPLNVDVSMDSMTIANKFSGYRQTISAWQRRAWAGATPVWFFLMWLFGTCLPLYLMFMGLVRYVSKTAAGESAINSYGVPVIGPFIYWCHRGTAAVTLVMTWVLAILILGNMFLWMMYLNFDIYVILIIWFPVLWIAEKLTKWYVPNPQVVTGGDAFDQNAAATAYRRMRVGSGQ